MDVTNHLADDGSNSSQAMGSTEIMAVTAVNIAGKMSPFEARKSAVPPRPFSASPRKADALDLLVRAAIVQTYARVRRMGVEQARATIAMKRLRYDDEATKLICRAASAPATTFDVEWASELVVAEGADLICTLIPRSTFAQLAAQGMHLTFSGPEILVPNYLPNVPGLFVRQGEPIPVLQGQTTGQLLTRKKMPCIVTYTGEMSEGAIVTMEGIFRTCITESTTLALDAVLLDDQPGSDVRPAGLRNGAVQVASTGTLHSDLQLLVEGLLGVADNHVRAPILIMNLAQAVASRMQDYRNIVPVIPSPSVAPGTVMMVDAADFACAGGQVPRVEMSKEAALHFDDVAPDHLDGASPVHSLWQEELLGLRVILEVDWCLRRPGVGCYMIDAHW
jgi:hypothetical protein